MSGFPNQVGTSTEGGEPTEIDPTPTVPDPEPEPLGADGIQKGYRGSQGTAGAVEIAERAVRDESHKEVLLDDHHEPETEVVNNEPTPNILRSDDPTPKPGNPADDGDDESAGAPSNEAQPVLDGDESTDTQAAEQSTDTTGTVEETPTTDTTVDEGEEVDDDPNDPLEEPVQADDESDEDFQHRRRSWSAKKAARTRAENRAAENQ